MEDTNIDAMLNQILHEKNKLEKLTKKIPQNNNLQQHTLKNHNHSTNNSTKNSNVVIGNTVPSNNDNAVGVVGNSNTVDKEMKELKSELGVGGTEFKHISRDTINKILNLLENYVNMDKSFKLKHDSLKTLYAAYLNLYKKHKNDNADNTKHGEMLKNIHSEMKQNNSNLYRERLIILKRIKETPEIDHTVKNRICGRLIAIFKAPPVPEYKPLQLLQQATPYDEEKISVNELDDAYLQKHNELLTVFKAYQNLYNKVLNYKEQLEKYKNLPTGSNISRCQMEKMLKDQRFVMDMIDKMQDNLVDNKIIDNSEKVLVTPVASNPDNMNAFNDTMRQQIQHIINRNININPNTKHKIENLLSQYKECDSNDKFCTAKRKLILLKKM